MKIPIIKTKYFILRPLRASDDRRLAELLNNKKINRRMGNIPYPYNLKDAHVWLKKVIPEYRSKEPKKITFAIEINKELVGAIDVNNVRFGHKAELGYWLGEEYWGKGIMSKVIKEIAGYAFRDLRLKRLQAHTFLFNPASRRVLEKNKFKLEGIIHRKIKKDKRYYDCYLLARVC